MIHTAHAAMCGFFSGDGLVLTILPRLDGADFLHPLPQAMEMMDIIRSRHSVRQYLDKPVPQEIRRQLDECAAALNREGDLRIQILYDEPGCFSSRMAHYGKCEHADNYICR